LITKPIIKKTIYKKIFFDTIRPKLKKERVKKAFFPTTVQMVKKEISLEEERSKRKIIHLCISLSWTDGIGSDLKNKGCKKRVIKNYDYLFMSPVVDFQKYTDKHLLLL
jgi:hypothetical protein